MSRPPDARQGRNRTWSALREWTGPDCGFVAHDARYFCCAHRKKIDISSVLPGQRLNIKEVDDGIWRVSFMGYHLGYIDLEQRTLQLIDNPIGARVSPPCLRYV